MAKKPSTGKGKRQDEGPAMDLPVTHKGVIKAATELSAYIRVVETILHSTATAKQKADLARLRDQLDIAGKAIAAIDCPNPMYNIVAIDRDQLVKLPPL